MPLPGRARDEVFIGSSVPDGGDGRRARDARYPDPAGRIDRVSFRVVGIGGSVDEHSQSDRVLRAVLSRTLELGAEVELFTGLDLDLPPYHTGAVLPAGAAGYMAAIRRADAVVISSPGYHGTVSGLVKNALDYLEELRGDDRPYLDGRAVGLIAVARGWQAAVSTLSTLRQVAHALRGWPTPLGLAINSTVTRFETDGSTADAAAAASVRTQAEQVVDFARRWAHRPS
jgi:FMN reductase